MAVDWNHTPLKEKDDGIIRIDSYEALLAFASWVNCGAAGARAVLTAEITAEDREWTPIGADRDCPFSGRFDGRGHSIIGLSNEAADAPEAGGLFGCVIGGSVWNVEVRDGRIRGKVAGGVAAVNEGEVVNCSFIGDVAGVAAAGGIAGCLGKNGVLGNCRFRGVVKDESAAGGFVGHSLGTVRGCRGSGDVTGVLAAGGVAGRVLKEGTVEDCSFLGSVAGGESCAGGVVGDNHGRVAVCDFFGKVTAKFAGGVAGDNSGELAGCKGADLVKGFAAGGVVGSNTSKGTVRACRFSGSVEGENAGGAVAGDNSGSLKDCEGSGSVTGWIEEGEGVWRIVGCDLGGSVTGCRFTAVPYGGGAPEN